MDLDLKKTVLGIELGSTRIKAVLINENHMPVASGSFEWENQLVDGIWTYSLASVNNGIQSCFSNLKQDLKRNYGIELTTVGALGVSGMMHGYLAFDKAGEQLAEFRTWRNSITGQAAKELSELFKFNIPQRWTIAHLYQAMLNDEKHVDKIEYLTTLAGYVHWKLTGKKCVGIGEASGMFPIDELTLDYNEQMLDQFDSLAKKHGYSWTIRDLLPTVMIAGNCAGYLSEEGARFLDPQGTLQAGIPVAPCEGDAGTGMAATNSVRAGTGNMSAGTSAFLMLVADHKLGVHREVDMVTTPDGLPVAMVHCSNCTSDINAWVRLFAEFAEAIGAPQDISSLYELLFQKAVQGRPDGGGLLSYNYFSGEDIMNINEGRPVFTRSPNCEFTLSNFMRTHLLSAMSTLKIGLDILKSQEDIKIDNIYAHGGFFKTPGVGQRILSAVVEAPVSIMDTAGEGGPYGMALLCAYMLWGNKEKSLAHYLDNRVFAASRKVTLMADKAELDGFSSFHERYKKGFEIERAAVGTI